MRKLLAFFGIPIKPKLTDLQKRRKAVLDDAIAYFNKNTRSFNEQGNCCYQPTPTSQGCAVGRLIADKELCKTLDANLENTGVGVTRVFNKLPIEVQELGESFLTDLQSLHDGYYNWDETGLSEDGISRVNSIKKYYIENNSK